MYIVLEGIDKTGKTSLAKFLSEKLNMPIVKFSQPKEHPYVEYMRFLLTDLRPVILDRFYLGERAYGPVKRGKSELSDDEIRNIEATMQAGNPFLIYCTSPAKRIRENFKKDGETYTTDDDIIPLKNAYQQAIRKSKLKWNKFDYRNDKDYKKIYRRILAWHQHHINGRIGYKKLRELRVVGNPFTKYLLVGDVCNTKLKLNRDPKLVIPFAFGKSADYLYKALELAKIDPSTIAITNLKKYHNGVEGIVREIIELKRLKRVVFLGRSPKPCRTNGVPSVTIRHPSWAARFNYPIEQYAAELKLALT